LSQYGLKPGCAAK